MRFVRHRRFRPLTAPQLPAAHKGTISAAEYAALAAKVEVEVGNIVANCKLPPQADAMLHIVLSDLAGGGAGENEMGTFLGIAADNSARVLLAFLAAWK